MQISVECMQLKTHLKTLIKVVREDFLHLEITDGQWKERVAWRGRIRITGSDNMR